MPGHIEGMSFTARGVASSREPWEYSRTEIARFRRALQAALKKVKFEAAGERHRVRDVVVSSVGPSRKSLAKRARQRKAGGRGRSRKRS